MFYPAHHNPLGFGKIKKLIKARTSGQDEDRPLKRLRQNYNFAQSTVNKQNKISLQRQFKRVSENLNYNSYKNQGAFKMNQRELIQNYRQNQINRNQVKYNINSKMVADQNQYIPNSVVYQRQKIDRAFMNIQNRQRAQINQIYANNYSLRYSRNNTSRGAHHLFSQFQMKNQTTATDRNSGRFLNLGSRKIDKIKTISTKSKNKTQRTSISRPNKLYDYQTYSLKGSKQFNQDSIKADDGVWIVCDGHGQHGHHVSSYASNLLYEIYKERIATQKFSKKMLRDIFLQVQKNLEESGVEVELSGSTCVMVVVYEDKLYCACIGDSVAVAIFENKQVQIISSQHKPCSQKQAQRIQFFGGVVKKTCGKEHLPNSPLRLWGQGIDQWGPGLAISRSFGDKMAQKYGLIYQPQIKQIQMTKSLKYIVLGSDGLFDQIKPTQIANILQIQNSQQNRQGCKLIAQIAQSRWIGYSDDISGIVLYM